ncbi:MAG: hypothetical protein HIU86_09050 [Acidobacteria bacterium]|nr:hypothetical protein [Acidobacteriota bacterium]
MSRTAGALLEQAGEYVHRFDRVSAGGRFEGVSSEGPIRSAGDEELLEATASLARLRRLVEAELTRLAGEIARRSESRDDSLARRMGAGSAANLVAQVAGIPRAQAGTMVASGVAFRCRESISGAVMRAVCPRIASAFACGLLDPEVAAGMRRALGQGAPGSAHFELDALEATLLETAAEGWGADDLLGRLKQVPAMAHPDGGAPRPDAPAPTRTVTRRELQRVVPVGAGPRRGDGRVPEDRGGREHGDRTVAAVHAR